MNYLAHACFSFQHPPWMVGNLVSDFIKGRLQYEYPPAIQQGIRLHRAIDTFTDAHEATKAAKEIFRPAYRLYAGAFVDVAYDYFLANDARYFSTPEDLLHFSQHTYAVLFEYYDVLPERFQQMLYRMREQNWLYNYRRHWGIEKSFGGLVYRSRYLQESATAFSLFEANQETLQSCYNHFIPDLQQMLNDWRSNQPVLD